MIIFTTRWVRVKVKDTDCVRCEYQITMSCMDDCDLVICYGVLYLMFGDRFVHISLFKYEIYLVSPFYLSVNIDYK